MGAVLEMKSGSNRAMAALLVAATLLASCGNDAVGTDYSAAAKGLIGLLKKDKSAAAPTLASLDQQGIATLRGALEGDGQAILLVVSPSLKYTNLMAPYGQNGNVQTWASTQYETLSLRAGMLVATRGFGADLMSSSGPDIAAIASGHGMTKRSYFYLDGGDHPRRFDYTCRLEPAGAEPVTVLGKVHSTRKVIENCTGSAAAFTNEYWFETGTNLRQSRQMMTPGLANLLLQRVID